MWREIQRAGAVDVEVANISKTDTVKKMNSSTDSQSPEKWTLINAFVEQPVKLMKVLCWDLQLVVDCL